MIKKCVGTIAACALALAMALCAGCGGEGKVVGGAKSGESEILEVYAPADLAKARGLVGPEHENCVVRLMRDIDMSGEEWTPIGPTLDDAFCGTFDGNGKTISGLRIAGWDNDGRPKYIAKEILGKLDSGEYAYASSEIVDIRLGADVIDEENDDREVSVVKKLVREGSSDDPNCVRLEKGKGKFAQGAAFGAVGLFGYARNATIRDFKLTDADLSFYASGANAYCGIACGFASGAKFENISIENGRLSASAIVERRISVYNDETGIPIGIGETNDTRLCAGGAIGRTCDGTEIANVEVADFRFDDIGYRAWHDCGLYLCGRDDEKLIVVPRGTVKAEWNVRKADLEDSIFDNNDTNYPDMAHVGGLTGMSTGTTMRNVAATGLNEGGAETEGADARLPIGAALPIVAKALFAGGISGEIGAGTVIEDFKSERMRFSAIYPDGSNYRKLISAKATIGGAVGRMSKSRIANGAVSDVVAQIGCTTEVKAANLSGVCAEASAGSAISDITISNARLFSDYVGRKSEGASEYGEQGSILSGAIGALRDSSIERVSAKNVEFNLRGASDESFRLVRGIASRLSGNSRADGCTAKNVRRNKVGSDSALVEWPILRPETEKNNYVNEDGYPSARLCLRNADGKTGGAYVTAYGRILKCDASGNALHDDAKVYEKAELGLEKGDAIELDRYYGKSRTKKNGKLRAKYYLISDKSADSIKVYDPDKEYYTKTDAYRVEFRDRSAGFCGLKCYEYDAIREEFFETRDKAPVRPRRKEYYARKSDIDGIAELKYCLEIVVYSESGAGILTQVEPDGEERAVALRYDLAELKGEDASERGSDGRKIPVAEAYFDAYFGPDGFKPDRDGRHRELNARRDFAKYALESGRPAFAADAFEYIYDADDAVA